eukprot:scaffold31142_cov18-Tisochrysis_lutea.AAC.2
MSFFCAPVIFVCFQVAVPHSSVFFHTRITFNPIGTPSCICDFSKVDAALEAAATGAEVETKLQANLVPYITQYLNLLLQVDAALEAAATAAEVDAALEAAAAAAEAEREKAAAAAAAAAGAGAESAAGVPAAEVAMLENTVGIQEPFTEDNAGGWFAHACA